MSNEMTPFLTLSAVQLFKSLADETRLRICLLLQREGELCVCELTEALADSQPKISRHLTQLRSSGLLQDRRQGQWIFYRLNPALPGWAKAILEQAGVAAVERLVGDSGRLQSIAARPSRCGGQ
ncbi:MAG: metalloregulator ArsR/SmtB family transcription factor [Aeromonadaceae bacterium]